ncbi:unnamed protein product [Arctia plantaginis]|uniref:Uncharacterized protein n=1 Tax=Arctia plantaginis TaxID=874455 RepID=A0A8S1AYP3_ARCPL|nr:unnamed protein product [Arctia plantaginis]
MNSLVVFLSVVALAVAMPSGIQFQGGLLAYSAPIIGSVPAAVSHQSRLDIKSSPAVTTTVVAAPTLLAAPAITTAAFAPAAVSSQSRIDIKSSPAITSTVVSTPVTYSAPALAFSSPLLSDAIAPAVMKTGYIAPAISKSAAIASLAFATETIAASDVPLDTPEVLSARAAHFEAKALAKAHLIKKRSVQLAAAPLATSYAAIPWISTYHAAPYSYTVPISLSSPLINKAYGVHAW